MSSGEDGESRGECGSRGRAGRGRAPLPRTSQNKEVNITKVSSAFLLLLPFITMRKHVPFPFLQRHEKQS